MLVIVVFLLSVILLGAWFDVSDKLDRVLASLDTDESDTAVSEMK